MDMRRHVPTWINNKVLVCLGGEYECTIADAIEQEVRNPFTARRERQPVIVFDDGYRCIPNVGMRRSLMELFGPHTEKWIGRRIVISRRRVERINRETGETTESWQKVVSCPDVHARVIQHLATERSNCDDSADPLTADEIFRPEAKQ